MRGHARGSSSAENKTFVRRQIYIAATGQHKGKTTCTLGVVSGLQSLGYNVGFCKPVGQQHLTLNGKVVDKDAVLFGDAIGFEVEQDLHSPIVTPSGFTARYLESPEDFDLPQKIKHAQAELLRRHEVVVYEGTGHPGVGSVIGLSNAKVAAMLGAEVFIIVEGGIGRTIDELSLSLSIFEREGVKVSGVIINKVHPDKIERVTRYNQIALDRLGIPLLGVIPYDATLSFPVLSTIVRKLNARQLTCLDRVDNRVEELLAGSLIEVDEFTLFQNLLLVVNHSRFQQAVDRIESAARQRAIQVAPLSGVIVTGDGRQGREVSTQDVSHPYLQQHDVPVITTPYDTYDSVVRIKQIDVKINTRTPWKVRRAIEIFNENIDLGAIITNSEELRVI
ncbi:MAG: AAA family ATPase [Myxococcota bacterium]|nr:AAA family ATPase [Myxococcota bacterium]